MALMSTGTEKCLKLKRNKEDFYNGVTERFILMDLIYNMVSLLNSEWLIGTRYQARRVLGVPHQKILLTENRK